MPSGIKKQPWHRQITESSAAHALLMVYLEMGEERNLGKVAEETGRKYETILALSSKHKWADRATAYDDYITTLQERTVQKSLKRDALLYARRRSLYREKEFTIAEQLLNQAQEMLAAPLYEETKSTVTETQIVNGEPVPVKVTYITLKPAGWNKATANKMVKVAAEIMRLNLEMETKRIGIVNLDSVEQNLIKARAGLEELVTPESVTRLVEQQLQTAPHLDPKQVADQVLKALPYWCAEDWKIPAEQVPLLTEGILFKNPFETDDALPLPEPDTDAVN